VGKRSRAKHDREPKPQQSVEVAPPAPDVRRARILAAILFIATLLSFSHVIKHDFVSFDDPIYITQNGHVRTGLSAANVAWAFTTYHAFNWHPLTWISHQLDVSLFGVEAGRLAAMNVLFHALSGVLLFFLMRAAPGDPLSRASEVRPLTPVELAALRARYGLDQPLGAQYVSFISGLVKGDLGVSIEYARPVTALLAERLPATLLLGGSVLDFGVNLTTYQYGGARKVQPQHQYDHGAE